MTHEPLHPKIDRMIAFLYGELPEAEEREFERLLAEDAELRSEYEELRSTRTHLEGWKIEGRVPSFVMLEEEKGISSAGIWRRFVSSLRALLGPPGWAFAGAAAVLFVLALAGLRVERLGDGIALRFGAPERPIALIDRLPTPKAPEFSAANGSVAIPASAAPYVTREEFQTYNGQLMHSLVLLLNEYSDRHEDDVTGLVRAVYDQVSSQRTYDYQELSSRLEAIGTEILIERNRRATSPSLDELLARRLGTGVQEPRELTPTRDREE